MSQENVEIVRRLFQAFDDRDLENLLPTFTDDVEFRLVGGFADMMGTEFRGHAGLRRFFAEWIGSLGIRAEIEAIFDVDDRVAVIVRSVGTGGASGAPATMRSAQIYFFRDGKVGAVDNYYEASEALEAVGLSEQDAHADP